MGMDSRNEMEQSMLSPQARQKFEELAALLAEQQYGPDGGLERRVRQRPGRLLTRRQLVRVLDLQENRRLA